MRHPVAARGFTLVELLIVIVVMAILSSIATFSFLSIQRNARDSERANKLVIVVEALEKYYDKNGQYPTVADMTYNNNDGQLTQLLGMKNDEPLRMPKAASSVHNSFGTGTATADKPVYSGGADTTSLCTSTYTNSNGLCTSYVITWVSEAGQTTTINSRRSG